LQHIVLSICFYSCFYEICIVLRRYGRYCSVKTLPKIIAEARSMSRNNSLFCLTLSLLTLPKKSPLSKVTRAEKHLLSPEKTASLQWGRSGVGAGLSPPAGTWE